jgi:hypothetical protein
MGADMVLYYAPSCDLTPERIGRLEQVIRAIPEDDSELHQLMESLGYEDAEAAKDRIIEQCQESQYESREITDIVIPGCPYKLRVTGGMSYGDQPTEACSVLEHVEHCPQAWEILERFAREDFAAANAPKTD